MKTTKKEQLKKKLNQKSKAKIENQVLPVIQAIPDEQPEDEGFYALVKEDEQLKQQHVAMLQSTPGNDHLSDEEASDKVDTMLRLCTLIYEILFGEDSQ